MSRRFPLASLPIAATLTVAVCLTACSDASESTPQTDAPNQGDLSPRNPARAARPTGTDATPTRNPNRDALATSDSPVPEDIDQVLREIVDQIKAELVNETFVTHDAPVIYRLTAHPYRDENGRSPIALIGEDVTGRIPFPDFYGEEPPNHPVLWSQAPRYANRQITVVGTITHTGRNRNGFPIFLNFTSQRNQFQIVLFDGAVDVDDPVNFYRGQTVLITHTVTSYQNKPQFELNHPGKIEIVDPADYAAYLDGSMAEPVQSEVEDDEPIDLSNRHYPDEVEGVAVIDWTQAPAHIGETVIIGGTLVDTYYDRSDPGTTNGAMFLNFTPYERNSTDFYAVIFPDHYHEFPGARADEFYLNKTVLVTGTIGTFNGRPFIELESFEKITVVEQDAE